MPHMPGTYHVFEKNRQVVVTDGTRIAYTESGHGDRVPIVLANGWSCSDAYWADVLPFLVARGHRVLCPDTRGHGESGLPRRPGRGARNISAADMSLERMARDLLEVCLDAEVDDAVFIGHSMGVQTILEVFRTDRTRVRGLVAVAGPYENPMKTLYGTSAAHQLWPVAQFGIRLMPEMILPAYRFMLSNDRVGHWGAITLKAAGPKLQRERFAPYLAHLASRDPRVMFKALESMRDHSAADLLPKVDVPFLIVAGEKDVFTPPGAQKTMHELAPGSELVVFEGAGHTLPLEEGERLCEELDKYLAKMEATST